MRAIRLLVMGSFILGWVPATALAQAAGLVLTTPFPSVAVAPGERVTFDLSVHAPGRQRVDLEVERVPRGWDAVLRGSGFVIGGVFSDPDDPPGVTLEVTVPDAASPGMYRVVVTGSSTTGTDELPIDIRIADVAAGGVGLTAEFPRLQGPADASYQFSLQLGNDTPRSTVFDLEGAGPPGWQVTVKPSTEELASSVEVEAGQSASLTVEVDPPDQTPAGAYPIRVRASGGGEGAETELTVRIIGNFAMTVTTPDERLNADVSAGSPAEVQIVVRNDGSAPLHEVQLSATSPRDWEVTFRPESIPEIAPGESVRAVAIVTPSDEAVAGDYIVTLSARTAETSSEVDLRTTVRTSAVWGVFGAALIVAAVAGLGVLFRRYGRR
jgi:uncharacterized membrane protein